MHSRRWVVSLAGLTVCAAGGWTFLGLETATVSVEMTDAAEAFVATLEEGQREKVVLAYDSPDRADWHFIPKDYRKGLQIKEMTPPQREAAHALLRSGLSQIGYDKATKIMQLEQILHELEKGRGSNIRDAERYYFTLFGKPIEKGRWGLSIEGHHLSLNFVVDSGEVVSSTPTFFAANPAIVKNAVDGGLPVGTRVLESEEVLAFQLVNSLNEDQRAKAIIAEEAPREIRAAGEKQPPQEKAAGISFASLDEQQKSTIKKLVTSYLDNLPDEVRRARLEAIRSGGPENVYFAWAGATEPGRGHYYRVQGPSFLIEFVNTQPDPAGNPANHIHCVWRDMRGDFGVALAP